MPHSFNLLSRLLHAQTCGKIRHHTTHAILTGISFLTPKTAAIVSSIPARVNVKEFSVMQIRWCERRGCKLAFCLASESRSSKGDQRRYSEDDPNHGAFPTFAGGDERGFLGGWGRADPGGSGSSFRRRLYGNGYYLRDFVTRFGTIRLRMARTRGKGFPPRGIARFERRGTKWRHNT